MEAARVVAIEAPEIDQFASRINLSLKTGFRLIQHRRSIDAHAPITRQQISTALEDLTSTLEPELDPSLLSIDCSNAGRLHLFPSSEMHIGQNVTVFVWNHLCRRRPSEDLFSVDDTRNLNDLAHLSVQLRVQRSPLGTPRCVPQNRLVRGVVHVEWLCHSLFHHSYSNHRATEFALCARTSPTLRQGPRLKS